MHAKLLEYSNFPDGLHICTVWRAIKKCLSKGLYTRKRLNHHNEKRFTQENMDYSQAYLGELYSLNPHRIKFFDESGFKTPDSWNSTYGYTPKGVRAIEMSRYMQSSNVTLNLLISTSGVEYANTFTRNSYWNRFLELFP